MLGFFIGTRPELIKLRPVVEELRRIDPTIPIRVFYVRQHLGIEEEIAVLDPDRLSFAHVSGPENIGHTIAVLETVHEYTPELRLAVVQGDTSSAAGAALAMAYQQIPVVHVEAGLRVTRPHSLGPSFSAPFPEEMNRQLVSRVAALHLAPTRSNVDNLQAECISPDKILQTGNPGITAAHKLIEKIKAADPFLTSSRRIVVTCHRRENWPKMEILGEALLTLAALTDVKITWILHPNRDLAMPEISSSQIEMILPQSHIATLSLLHHADLIVTDSGGIIEEATYLGKKLVVLRNETERPEARAALCSPEDPGRLTQLLQHQLAAATTDIDRLIFGDERSAWRCAKAISTFYGGLK